MPPGNSAPMASRCISSITGPGLPFFRASVARRIIAGILSADVIESASFVMCWKLRGPPKFGCTSVLSFPGPSGMKRIGTASAQAWANPPKEFSVPGPPWHANTPYLPCDAMSRE